MTTNVVPTPLLKPGTRRGAEHPFFVGIALLIVAAVLIGFAHTYFLAGMFRAKLPSLLVHLHGAAFSGWIALLTTQVFLVSAKRVRWHMRLGVAGMFLAPLMIVLGFATMVAAIRRNFASMAEMRIILVVNTITLVLFGCLVLWAFLARRDSPSHKRLMILATLSILGPAIDRWPFRFMGSALSFFLALDSLFVLLAAYDLWTRRSLHRTTTWGLCLTAAWQILYRPIAHSRLVDHAISWLQRV